MKKNKPVYKLNSRDDAQKFDKRLMEYSEHTSFPHPDYLSLTAAWDRLDGHKLGGRIFSGVLDLKINFVLLSINNSECQKAWSEIMKGEDDKTEDLLESQKNFFTKMNLHENASSYILRYRAIWDKIFGLLILMHAPKEYGGFISANSRKGSFLKVAETLPDLFDEESINLIRKFIDDFNDVYRTPEAHQTGKLRKHSFILSFEESEYIGNLIFNSWNILIEAIAQLDKNIGKG